MLLDALAPQTSGLALDLDCFNEPRAGSGAPHHQLQHSPPSLLLKQRPPATTAAARHPAPPTKHMVQQQEPIVHLSALLDIAPCVYNTSFWASTTAVLMTRILDTLFFLFTLAIDAATWVTPPGSSWAVHHAWPPLGSVSVPAHLLFSCLQAVGALLELPFYSRLRPQLLHINRLIRVSHAWLNLSTSRHHLLSLATSPLHRPPLPALLLASLAPTSLLQTLFLHLPFRAQAPLQLAHCALLIAHLALPAARLASSPDLRPQLTSLCTILDSVTDTTMTTLAGLPSNSHGPPTPSICTAPYTPWLLVILTQAVAALVLPLSIAYLFEVTAKSYYMHHDLNQHHFARLSLGRLLVACLKTAVIISLYTLLLWALLRRFHPVLAAVALPAGWDWDLLKQ